MARKAVYPTDWLNERYPFDCTARNQEVEAVCRSYLKDKTSLQLVDIGAGNGANTRYFFDTLPQDQSWTLLDLDPKLGEASLYELAEHGRTRGYLIETAANQLTMTQGGKTVHIRTISGSLLELDQLLNLSEVDLVMANAVFDLFSESQFIAFVQSLFLQGIPFLATLNYWGMGFLPTGEDDEEIIDLYESHMQRLQDFGRAMGRGGPERMLRWLEANAGKLVSGDSSWKISPPDLLMLQYLLGFMEEAIPELPLTDEQSSLFEGWLRDKHDLRKRVQLSIDVFHKDIFATATMNNER